MAADTIMSYDLARLNADIAQIQHVAAGFGTGRLVANNLVLTAAHTLWDKNGVGPYLDEWQVRLTSDRLDNGAWNFRPDNKVRWFDADRDLALIELLNAGAHPLRSQLCVRIAAVTRNNPHPVEARGYPSASKERQNDTRKLIPALGRLTAGELHEPLRFGVDQCDLPNEPHEGWPGMSGSAVTLRDWIDPNAIWVYGIIRAVPGNFDRQLSVVRLSDAWQQDAEFRRILTEAGLTDREPEDPTRNLRDDLRSVPVKHRLKIEKFIRFYLGSPTEPVPFGGRQDMLQQLSAWLGAGAAPRQLLVTAPAGRGKTALVANWMQLIPPSWQIVFVPISIRFETNHPTTFYEALAHQLAPIAGDQAGATQRDAAEFYKDRCLELLDTIGRKRVATVIIIDGLDEAFGWEIDQLILQANPESETRIVVTARTLVGHESGGARDAWLDRLDWAPGRAECIHVPPLSRAGIGEALESMGYPVAGLANRGDVLERLEHLTEGGDPLLVRMYADSLWSKGADSQKIAADELTRLDPGYSGFFRNWFEKQSGSWSDPTSPIRKRLEAILALLSVTLGPIEHRSLEAVCAVILQDPACSFSKLDLQPLQRFMLGEGVEHGYTFQHPRFSQYFREEYFKLGNMMSLTEDAVFSWCADIVRDLNSGKLSPSEVPPYALEHYVQHIAGTSRNPKIEGDLLERGWQFAWFNRDSGYARYSADIQKLMEVFRSAAHLDPGRRLELRLRCALILSSIRSIGANVPGRLLVALVQHKNMTVRQALHLFRLKDMRQQWLVGELVNLFDLADSSTRPEILEGIEGTECEFKAGAMSSLAIRLPEGSQTEWMERALMAAERIGSNENRGWELAKLADYLPDTLLPQALKIADELEDNHRSKVKALGSLAQRFPEPNRTEVMARALACVEEIAVDRWITVDNEKAWALKLLVECDLPGTLMTRALHTALGISDERWRAAAIMWLAERLVEPDRTEWMARAMGIAAEISNERLKASWLGWLTEPLPEADRAKWTAQAFSVAAEELRSDQSKVEMLGSLTETKQMIALKGSIEERTQAAEEQNYIQSWITGVVKLAKRLPEPNRREWMERALVVSERISNDGAKLRALKELVEWLPDTLLDRALTIADGINNDSLVKVSVLESLARRLPEPNRIEWMARALEAAEGLGLNLNTSEALRSLSENLPETLLERALKIADAVEDGPSSNESKSAAIVRLAARLPEAGRTEWMARALKAAVVSGRKVEALGFIAEYLPESLLQRALQAAQQVGDEQNIAEALGSLAARMQEPNRTEWMVRAVQAAEGIENGQRRAEALGSLAEHMLASGRTEWIERALTAGDAIADIRLWVTTLAALAKRLPEPIRAEWMGRVLITIERINNDRDRASVLEKLLDCLPDTLLDRALAIADGISNDTPGKALVLGSLAIRLPDPDRTEWMSRALTIAESFSDQDTASWAVEPLIKHLPKTLLERMVTATPQLGNLVRARAMASLAEHLEEPDRTEGIMRALTVAEGIRYHQQKVETMSLLAEHLAEPERTEWLTRALAVAEGVADSHPGGSYLKARMLTSLGERLPIPLLKKALAAAEGIRNSDGDRVSALSSLAARLPEPDRTEWMTRALTVSEGIRDDRGKAGALVDLAKHLPEGLMERVLTAAEKIPNEGGRSWALRSLAEYLPPTLLWRILAAAEKMEADWPKAMALSSLAERLPEELAHPVITNMPDLIAQSHRTNAMLLLKQFAGRISSYESNIQSPGIENIASMVIDTTQRWK